MHSTLTHILSSQAGRPESKNHQLYQMALEKGAGIAEITKPGEVILLAKKSGNDLFSAFIGAILVGRIPLIIQRPSPKVHQTFFDKRMTDLKAQVNAKICFCEKEDNEKYDHYFSVTNFLATTDNQKCPIIYPKKEDLAFIQMSSGTTGVSKICEITHGQIVDHCRVYGRSIGMGQDKCVVSWLPLYHDMGLVAAFLLPLIHDAEFHIIDPFDWLMNPRSLLDLVSKFKATHCWMPSFAFNYLSNKVSANALYDVKLNSLERVISCSEPTFFDDLDHFRKNFTPLGLKPESVCVCYALAENTFAVSQSDGVKETEWKGVKYTSCGETLVDVEVDIRRGDIRVIGIEDGNVWIKSPWMPRTNKVGPDGWYNTGDIGFFKDGNLYIIGREKDMFISYGVNVYPEMVEHLIANIEGVIPGRVVCFGDFDKILGTNRIIALAETADVGNNALRMELSTLIKEEFNLTAIVKLVAPGSLIKTSSGKFCRIKNKESYGKNNTRSS